MYEYTFTYADPAQLKAVTILAMQKGNKFTDYTGTNGAKVNKFWTQHIEDGKVIERYKKDINITNITCFVFCTCYSRHIDNKKSTKKRK